ncbi:hypothetical protein AcV5_006572 [Taiwanofungus camphoratus]|nr:hypothetical protein AcW2_005012 [Antrodia cinnamomea]KAI0934877.1 hypothetical protein AcV5_006572 [Antrodia cinnamomea]
MFDALPEQRTSISGLPSVFASRGQAVSYCIPTYTCSFTSHTPGQEGPASSQLWGIPSQFSSYDSFADIERNPPCVHPLLGRLHVSDVELPHPRVRTGKTSI